MRCFSPKGTLDTVMEEFEGSPGLKPSVKMIVRGGDWSMRPRV